jgi:neutral ceramidase
MHSRLRPVKSSLLAGAAELVITPPLGAPTLGTIQRSTGVHDDLFARALVLNDGKQKIAILSLDLIGMDFVLADHIRAAIGARAGIAVTLVHCTHNHSAPFTIPWSVLGPRWLSGPGKTWRDGLAPRLAELVSVAEAKSEPVVLRAGRSPVHIGTNRRLPSEQGIVMKPNPEGPIVPWVDVLRVDRFDGSPATILFSHAAHPVIIHGSSRLISAEFPGFAVRKLKERFGGDVIAMFGQAFAGNINADPLRGGIAAAEHAGEVLAEATFQAASNSKNVPSQEFKITAVHAKLPLQPLPSQQECSQVLEAAEKRLAKCYGQAVFSDEQLWNMQDEAETAKSQEESTAQDDVQPMEGKAWWMIDTVLCLRDLLNKVEQRDERPLRFEAHMLRIGDHWSLLAATHELFAEYQLTLDKAAPTKHNMMLAYTNGCESYIPMDRDLPLGGYEAATFPADGAALRYRHRRALGPGFEGQVTERLRSLWA